MAGSFHPRRVAPRFRRPKPPGLFQDPDRNAGVNNARFTAGNTGRRFDTGENVAEITDNPLQQLGFLGPRQGREQFLSRLEGGHRGDS